MLAGLADIEFFDLGLDPVHAIVCRHELIRFFLHASPF
jgi:hypothetical protein